jgi:indole-3-glycerol phosphate synthase
MTILEKIILNKRREVAGLKEKTSLRDLENKKFFSANTHSLSASISDPVKKGIIAEFKRMSPSKGVINSEAYIEEVTLGYATAGASGLSILTDRMFFGGSNEDLVQARELNNIPILRKDFIIDEIQVVEAKAAGADAILLIAAILDRDRVSALACLSRSLRMEVLLEVHSLQDLEMVNEYVNIVGINNRDLRTFSTNINISHELANKVPGQFLKISESGISSPSVLKYLRCLGFDGFLIGELFMSNRDPVAAFSDFVKEIS